MTRGWRTIFGLEILTCAATCVVWTVAPESFLGGVLGLDGTDPRVRLLLAMTTNVVGCAYVYLYARLLFDRPFPLRAFRRLQEAMALGDVVVLVTSGLEIAWLSPSAWIVGAQIGMASLWLAIRMTWLWQSP